MAKRTRQRLRDFCNSFMLIVGFNEKATDLMRVPLVVFARDY